MTTSDRELVKLSSWAAEHGLQVSDESLAKIRNYLDLLKIWSGKLRLISTSDVPLLARKHLPDCFVAAAQCPTSGTAADLGSGAGLPGIPIAIVLPDLDVDLIESRAKKISFLTQACQGLPNARPVNQRLEAVTRNNYDVVTARALAPLDKLLPLSRPLLRKGGLLLAMKSALWEEELGGLDPAEVGCNLEKQYPYTLPTGEKRVLLTFRAD